MFTSVNQQDIAHAISWWCIFTIIITVINIFVFGTSHQDGLLCLEFHVISVSPPAVGRSKLVMDASANAILSVWHCD